LLKNENNSITSYAPSCREKVIDGVDVYIIAERDTFSLYYTMLIFIDNPNLTIQMEKEKVDVLMKNVLMYV